MEALEEATQIAHIITTLTVTQINLSHTDVPAPNGLDRATQTAVDALNVTLARLLVEQTENANGQ